MGPRKKWLYTWMSPEFPGEKILSGRKIAPDPLNVYIDPVQTYNLKKKLLI